MVAAGARDRPSSHRTSPARGVTSANLPSLRPRAAYFSSAGAGVVWRWPFAPRERPGGLLEFTCKFSRAEFGDMVRKLVRHARFGSVAQR